MHKFSKSALLACAMSAVMIFFTRASLLSEHQLFDLMLPNIVENFKYRPTLNGYQYGFSLYDGRRHQEMGYITDENDPDAAMYIRASNNRRPRPKERPDKKRKLAAGSLKGLAG